MPLPCPCPVPPANLGTREARLGDVGLIVLDEVHYLGDPSRGSVWEEVIINCPKHIQLLCMSATVRNPDDLGAWISQVGGGGQRGGREGSDPDSPLCVCVCVCVCAVVCPALPFAVAYLR